MSDVKLRPCPFCGGGAVLTEDRYAYSGAPFKVECQNCGANRTDYERGGAVAAWNRRKDEPPHGDCEKCIDDPDYSCPFCGEPCGCNNRELGEKIRNERATK